MRRAIAIGAVLSFVLSGSVEVPWGVGCNSATVVPRQTVVVPSCPDGSAFDTAKGFCVAAPLPTIAEPARTGTLGRVALPGSSGTTAPIQAPPVRLANTNAVVACDFPDGWVSLLPVAAYPRDDQFLMQSLIGLTQDPKFWKSADPAYAKISSWAAQRCTSGGVAFAVPAGDYWVLAGQENTFGAKGKYDKNGVRRRVTVPASPAALTLTLRAADLTHTWLCISCPWVEIAGFAPFVVLRHRSSRAERGTDTVALARVPVRGGRVRLQVSEREPETTFLDALVLRAGGRTLFPAAGGARSPLAAADGVPVVIERGGAVTVDYTIAPELVSADGTVDLELLATGHYEPYAAP